MARRSATCPEYIPSFIRVDKLKYLSIKIIAINLFNANLEPTTKGIQLNLDLSLRKDSVLCLFETYLHCLKHDYAFIIVSNKNIKCI